LSMKEMPAVVTECHLLLEYMVNSGIAFCIESIIKQ
jgi:hypothetical protein